MGSGCGQESPSPGGARSQGKGLKVNTGLRGLVLRFGCPLAAERPLYSELVNTRHKHDVHSHPTSSLRAPSPDLPTPHPKVGGAQRPNLKSEDSGLRHRFSEAKVSLWMCENGAGHEESRGPTRRRLCCTPFQNFSQRERDVEECHRRVGRVGPEYQSSRRGRGEQRRPLRRRGGNMGACPPPLRGRSAVVARNAACTSGEPKIDSHVDFDLTAAWRHHVSMLP